MNEILKIDEFKIPDYEDGTELNIIINSCTELGNSSQPGLQITYMGNYAVFEPLAAQKWNYELKKRGTDSLLLDHFSWIPGEDNFVKIYFLNSQPLKAKVEAKTKSSAIVSKEYELPFQI